jgi:HlyD family type I secretion membrane fusion protein
VDWPADAAAEAVDARDREHKLFDARRRVLAERVASLEGQLGQAHARTGALGEQTATLRRSAELARAEMEMNRELVASGFVQKARLVLLERGVADSESRAAAAASDVAAARAQQAQLANAIAQARADHRQQAADELKDAGARLAEIEQRLRPTEDQRDRQTVRAPVDGVVMALRVSAPGTAVGAREPLLEIAPSAENLVVETRIEPRDIDHVRSGGAAEVRLLAFDTRRVPLLPATVKSVSPDASADAPGQPVHYRAQVEVSAHDLARHPALKLQAGMPVEVFIATPERTPWQYLAEPLAGFARRAMREP